MNELLLSCGKNYKNALKQLFTVLGILFLSILLGCSALYYQTVASFTQLKEDVIADFQEADLSLTYLSDAVEERAEEFGLGDVIRVIEQKSLMPLIEGKIENAVRKIIGNYQDFAEQLEEDITICAQGLCIAVLLLVLILVLGMLISFFTADIIVRCRQENAGFLQILKEMLLRFAGFAVATAVVLLLYNAFPESWKVFAFLYPFLVVFMGLLTAWLSARSLGAGFKDVVTWKNYFGLLIMDILMLAVSGLIGWALYAVFNIVVAGVMILALVIITLAALDLSVTGCAAAAVKKISLQTAEPVLTEAAAEPALTETAQGPAPEDKTEENAR